MQFRLLASIVVFLGSYLPLGLILLAQDFDYNALGHPLCWTILDPTSGCALPLRNPSYSLVIFGICLLCFILSLAALASVKPSVAIDVQEASYIPAELMSYTLPYVVSFMALDYQETGKFVGLIIFLAWMFWITYKSGQLILNPVLVAFGWRLYEISYTYAGDAQVRSGRALASRPVEPNQRYRHAVIQDVMIVRPDEQAQET